MVQTRGGGGGGVTQKCLISLFNHIGIDKQNRNRNRWNSSPLRIGDESAGKGAIEIIHLAQSEWSFYSRYFLIPKKDGDLRPILDLRLLNYALMKRSLRMIPLKQILLQICPGGLVLFAGSERHLLSNSDSPPPEAVLEIRLWGTGLSIHGPSLWAVPSSPHFCDAVRRKTALRPLVEGRKVTFTSTAWKYCQYGWAFGPFCQTWGDITSYSVRTVWRWCPT